MRFYQFLRLLQEAHPSPFVPVELMRQIINQNHQGVGKVSFRYFPDFAGAGWGNFIWLEEDRTSPYDECFKDAIVFVNSNYEHTPPMRRIICAKELMHVFDDPHTQTRDANAFRILLSEIEAKPMIEDTSAAYRADRIGLWKAIIALVPPWLREPYLEQWNRKEVKAHELGVRWNIPAPFAAAAMGGYYETAYARCVTDEQTPKLRMAGGDD